MSSWPACFLLGEVHFGSSFKFFQDTSVSESLVWPWHVLCSVGMTPTLRETYMSGTHFPELKNLCSFAQGLPCTWKQASLHTLCLVCLSKAECCGSAETASSGLSTGTAAILHRSSQLLTYRQSHLSWSDWETELPSPACECWPQGVLFHDLPLWQVARRWEMGEISCLLLSMLGSWKQTLKVWGLVMCGAGRSQSCALRKSSIDTETCWEGSMA